MALDDLKNFAKVTVSTTYDASATSIVLTTGHGAKLPTVPFNLTWWDATTYADPSDDPNVEIVRGTALATDTLTVTRAQEGTSASTKNTSSKTYKMLATLTAKSLETDLPATYQGLALSGQIGSSDTITASVVGTTETAFSTSYTIPANHFTTKRGIRVTITYQYTSSSSPATLLFRLKLGGTTVRSTTAAVPGASQTNRGISDGLVIMGTAAPGASVNVESGLSGPTFHNNANVGNNTAQPVALATNGTLALTVTAEYGANTAGNSVTLRQLIVEPLTAL